MTFGCILLTGVQCGNVSSGEQVGYHQIQYWPLALFLSHSGLHMGWDLSLERLFVWNHYLLHTILGGEYWVWCPILEGSMGHWQKLSVTVSGDVTVTQRWSVCSSGTCCIFLHEKIKIFNFNFCFKGGCSWLGWVPVKLHEVISDSWKLSMHPSHFPLIQWRIFFGGRFMTNLCIEELGLSGRFTSWVQRHFLWQGRLSWYLGWRDKGLMWDLLQEKLTCSWKEMVSLFIWWVYQRS